MLSSEKALLILQSYNAFQEWETNISADMSVLGKFSIENEDAPSLDDLRTVNLINELKSLHNSKDSGIKEYAQQAELLVAYSVYGVKVDTLEWQNQQYLKLDKINNKLIKTQDKYIKQLETENKNLKDETTNSNNIVDALLVSAMIIGFACVSFFGLTQPKDKGGFCELTQTCQVIKL